MATFVIATCWLNDEDYQAGNAKTLAYAWAPKLNKALLRALLGASLPFHVAQGTTVDVRLSRGPGPWITGVLVIDCGPWRTDDDYIRRGGRPAAESMKGQRVGWDKTRKGWFAEATPQKYKCNGAGIDLTPAVYERLYGKPAGSLWSKSPGDLVDVRLHEPGGK